MSISSIARTLLLCAIMFSTPRGSAQAQLIAYDGFNYTPGTQLDAQNGGVGWTSAWTATGDAGATIVADSLIYKNLKTTGGSAITPTATLTGNNRNFASLGATNEVVYFSFLFKCVDPLDVGTQGKYRLMVLNHLETGTGSGYGYDYGMWYQTLQNTTIKALQGETVFLTIRATFQPGNDKYELFVNPTPGEPLPAPDAVKEDFDDTDLHRLTFGSDGAIQFDEFRMGHTWEDVSPTEPSIPFSLGVTPSPVSSGNASLGTVTLDSPAATDVAVSLASSQTSAATVPPTVTVPAGQSSATFPVSTAVVKVDRTATISATVNGVTKTADLLVTPTKLLSVMVSPSSILGGKTVAGTVRISRLAPDGGWEIALTSTNSAASVPASVVVPAGFASAKFTITTTLPDLATTGNISASFGGTTKAAPLTVQALIPVSLTVTPSTVLGAGSAAGKLTINGAAPAGGKTVSLTCTNTAATCPASITVTAGKTSVSFTISTTNPATDQTGDVSTIFGGVTKSAPLNVNHSVTTKIVADVLKAPAGSSVTFGATLTRTDDYTGLSGKTLSFYAGATLMGTGTTDGNGRATMTVTAPVKGVKQNITVKFAGDTTFEAGSGTGSVTGN